MASALYEICCQSVSARGSTSPILRPAGTAVRSATRPRTRPGNGARTCAPATVPSTSPACTSWLMRACQLMVPAAGARSTRSAPRPPITRGFRCWARPSRCRRPGRAAAAHRLDDRVAVAAGGETGAEGHHQQRVADRGIEQALGHPRVDDHVRAQRPGGRPRSPPAPGPIEPGLACDSWRAWPRVSACLQTAGLDHGVL